MTYIVSGGELKSTHSLTLPVAAGLTQNYWTWIRSIRRVDWIELGRMTMAPFYTWIISLNTAAPVLLLLLNYNLMNV